MGFYRGLEFIHAHTHPYVYAFVWSLFKVWSFHGSLASFYDTAWCTHVYIYIYMYILYTYLSSCVAVISQKYSFHQNIIAALKLKK